MQQNLSTCGDGVSGLTGWKTTSKNRRDEDLPLLPKPHPRTPTLQGPTHSSEHPRLEASVMESGEHLRAPVNTVNSLLRGLPKMSPSGLSNGKSPLTPGVDSTSPQGWPDSSLQHFWVASPLCYVDLVLKLTEPPLPLLLSCCWSLSPLPCFCLCSQQPCGPTFFLPLSGVCAVE